MANAVHIAPREQAAAATRRVDLTAPFGMQRGGSLPQVTIAYETWGQLTPAGDNAVLLYTGLSPSPHAASSPADPSPGWWEYMIGPGKPIDTDRFHVICINNLGSCFGSTGPASINPETGRAYGSDFPELTIEDIAHAGREAMHALGIKRLKAVVGASLGGMAALAHAIRYPSEVENLALISAAPRATASAIAIRSLQRQIITSDPAWQGGYYDPNHPPVQGMLLARKLGLISYRSATEWQQRFGRRRQQSGQGMPFGVEFDVESYMEANAHKFVGNFDANSYLYLSRAMDWFDIDDYGGSMAAAAKRLRSRRHLVVGVETDFLFPLEQQREIADGLRKASLETDFSALPSLQGHDAFLVDETSFAPVLKQFFQKL